eukprot:gene1072-1358_t
MIEGSYSPAVNRVQILKNGGATLPGTNETKFGEILPIIKKSAKTPTTDFDNLDGSSLSLSSSLNNYKNTTTSSNRISTVSNVKSNYVLHTSGRNSLLVNYYSSSNNNSNNNNSNIKKQIKESKPAPIQDNSIESISKEISEFENNSNIRKDWPINSEVAVYPVSSIPFISFNGSFSLTPEYIPKLIPNAAGVSYLGLFQLKEEYRNSDFKWDLVSNPSEYIHHVGVIARISLSAFGYYSFVVEKKVHITSFNLDSFPVTAQIEPFPSDNEEINIEDPRIPAMKSKINQMVLNFQHKYPDSYTSGVEQGDLSKLVMEHDNVEKYISGIILYFGMNYPEKNQEMLETVSDYERLQKFCSILEMEEKFLESQQQISGRLDEKKSGGGQKRFFLLEQLKKIKSDLGMEFDEKERVLQKYQTKLSKLKVNESQRKLIEDEISKLSTIDPSSMEYNSSRNYIDWLTNLPWGHYTPEFFDLKYSKDVLDQDHFGLTDIKQRILEFISVGHLKGSVMGKIICFIGPPGTGKTSIAKSIAKCLKREFYRFSVGGLFDEGEIKGHRRTYIGSMPGKLIQCMKLVQTSNPVILIDEIDKIGRRNLGDPSSALLEVLDPEQNYGFIDHYLDTPYDLSRVLFICTANSDQTIPEPLFDRMEVINLSGYVEEEQIQIVKKFIIPKTLVECGLKPEQLTITDEVVKDLVKFYSREVGIRELERLIEKIMRKTALEIVNGAESVVIDKDNLEDYLGIPAYSSDRYYNVTPVGVVNGLAWSPRGGSTLYIETIVDRSQSTVGNTVLPPRLRTTGKLGEVMTESSNIAYTYAKNFLFQIDPENKFFETTNLHMHVPQGGKPKDGPSAGVTMVTSLLSLAMNEPVLNNVGMTGEVTVTGKVYTIGGVKEKTIAAKRSGLVSIIIPTNNKKDFEELPDYIKEGIDVDYASEYKDVFAFAFPNKKHLLENLKPIQESPPIEQPVDKYTGDEKFEIISATNN